MSNKSQREAAAVIWDFIFQQNPDLSDKILTFNVLILYFQWYKLMWTVFRPKSPSWSTVTHSASWRWQPAITRSWIQRRIVSETVSSKQREPWRRGRRPIARGSNAWKNRYFNSKCGSSVGKVDRFASNWGVINLSSLSLFFIAADSERAARSGDEKTTGLFQSDAATRCVGRDPTVTYSM